MPLMKDRVDRAYLHTRSPSTLPFSFPDSAHLLSRDPGHRRDLREVCRTTTSLVVRSSYLDKHRFRNGGEFRIANPGLEHQLDDRTQDRFERRKKSVLDL